MCGSCVLEQGLKTLTQHDIDSVQAVYPPSGSGDGWGGGGAGGLPKL
jgi:hypothetical protein